MTKYIHSDTNIDKVIGISEAAKLLNVSKMSLRRWDKNPDSILKAFRTQGGHRKYKLSDIEKIMESKNEKRDTFM